MRFRGAIVVGLLVAALLSVPATAATGGGGHQGSGPAQGIATARKALSKLPTRSFAAGQRAKVLRSLGRGATGLRRHHVCQSITALDATHSLVLSRGTWRRGPPRVVRRTIAPLLNRVERALGGKAHSCAAVTSVIARPVSNRVGGHGFTPVPSYSDINSQGAGEPDSTVPAGTFRPLPKPGPQVQFAGTPQFVSTASPTASGSSPANPFARELSTEPRAGTADDSAFEIGRSVNLGVPPTAGEPKEMTTAIGHNVVWYTGNKAVGYSLNGGKDWSELINPSTFLPDPANHALCCDQQVIYAPAANLFVWVLQYYCPATAGKDPDDRCENVPGNNIIRFAVTTPEELRRAVADKNLGAAWHVVMDLTPQQLGEPPNAWFDYSTISVNDAFVNWTVDIFEGTHDSVAMRIHLNDLAAHRFNGDYFFSQAHTLAVQQPPGQARSLFVTAHTLSQLRVWSWNQTSTVAVFHDIDHGTTPTYDTAIPGTDGIDWNARSVKLVGIAFTGAWTHNQLVVGIMNGRTECDANCDSGTPQLRQVFKHPGVELVKIDTIDWTRDALFGELWSVDFGISWPELGVDKDGDIGLSFLASAENQNPVAWAGFLTLHGDQFVHQVSDPNAGPQPGIIGKGSTTYSGGTGDYYSLQPGSQPDSFVMPFRSMDPTPSGFTDDWHFVSYGHTPPYPPSPPSVRMTSPTPGATFTQGTRIGFNAAVSDSNDVQIPYDAIYWRIDGNLTPYHGTPVFIDNLDYGDHTVTVTAVNSAGLSASSSVKITIVPPNPGAPTVSIDSPLDGAGFQATDSDNQGDYVDVPMQAQASDPGGKALVYSWDDTVSESDGESYSEYGISHDLSPTLRLYVHETNCGTAEHTLTLNASDGSQASTATVHVYVTSQLCVK